jgi:tetratricopeptide (TPR) repeat protein
VAEFKQAVALDPRLLVAQYNLGQAYMALKRYVEAAAAYEACRQTIERLNGLTQREREALARASEDEIGELRQSVVRIRSGQIRGVGEPEIIRIEERIRLLEGTRLKGAEHIQVPPAVPLALGSAYFRQGRLEEAEKEYLAALRRDKKLGPAHNNLAVIYLLTGRYPQARRSIEAAENSGFRVSPQFKADLASREGQPPPR